jgi:hypothetical protein
VTFRVLGIHMPRAMSPPAILLCLLAFLLFCLPFQVSAQSAPQVTDAPKIPLAGMHSFTAGSALVWAESVHSFQMWQVDIGGAGANAQARWSSRTLPAELSDFKKGQRDYQPEVSVNFDGGVTRVFWAEADKCPPRTRNNRLPCISVAIHIHQAQRMLKARRRRPTLFCSAQCSTARGAGYCWDPSHDCWPPHRTADALGERPLPGMSMDRRRPPLERLEHFWSLARPQRFPL